MCGRFVLGDYTWAEYYDALTILNSTTAAREEPDYNIAPTQMVNIVVKEGEDLVAATARWWLIPHWHRGDARTWKATTFNAKIETAAEKPTFRDAWKRGRCIIPASGYYEWTGTKGKKQPWFISLEDMDVFYFMGLYTTLADGTKTCAIVTREAAPEIANLHTRMPVILTIPECQEWLNHATSNEFVLESYGKAWTNRFLASQVAPFGAKDQGPRLVQPIYEDW